MNNKLYTFLEPDDPIQDGDESLVFVNPTKTSVTHLLKETKWLPVAFFLYGHTQRYSGDITRRRVVV